MPEDSNSLFDPSVLTDPNKVSQLLQDPEIQKMIKIRPEAKVPQEAYTVIIMRDSVCEATS